MTKYYFFSFICSKNGGLIYGNGLTAVKNQSLAEIERSIQEINNSFERKPTIIGLKELSKKEYKMLKGEKDE